MKPLLEKEYSIGYFGGMDVLRFTCAAGVVFHHATLALKEKGIPTHAESIHRFSGAFFLDVFFIISGFLISLILMKEFEAGAFSLKNFYMRRIIRIWPLFFLAVLVKIIIFPMLKTDGESIAQNLLYACTFSINYQLLLHQAVKTYTILWSICIEEHIYLLLPLLLLLFKNKFKLLSGFMCAVGIASWFYFLNISSVSGFNSAYFVSTSYFYYFGIGMIIACIKNGTLPGKSLETMLFQPWIQIAVSLVFFTYVFNVWGSKEEITVILSIHGLFGAYLVWAATQENYIFFLKPKLSRYFGNISYAMYICHPMTIAFAIGIFKKKNIHFSEGIYGWGLPILALLFCIGLSTLLFIYFEQPILKFKKKFTSISNK